MDLKYYQPKNKTEKWLFSYLWVISPVFFNDTVNSLVKNASIIHFKFVERRWNTMVKSIFVWNGSCCRIQNHILKKQNAIKLKLTNFPVLKNTIKRIAFKNEYESSIIYKSFFICLMCPLLIFPKRYACSVQMYFKRMQDMYAIYIIVISNILPSTYLAGTFLLSNFILWIWKGLIWH